MNILRVLPAICKWSNYLTSQIVISENVFHTVGGIAYENKYQIYYDLAGDWDLIK